MNSALYLGRVVHRRHVEPARSFSYRLFMAWLDLDEIPEALDGAWPLWSARRPALAWFRRGDFLGAAADGSRAPGLKDAVLARVEAELGRRPDGPVRMLAHLRCFGLSFNPVAFYYCFSSTGDLDAIVAEITNTPWLERHAYVLDARAGLRFRFRKSFHVSPFLPMDHEHDWRFGVPGASLSVSMRNWRDGRPAFDAALALRRRPLTRRTMAAALARHPFMSGKVVAGIYWQALILALRRAPFHPHPVRHPEEAARAARRHEGAQP